MEVVKSDEKIEEYIKKSNILIIMYTTFLCTACDSIKHKVIEYGKSRDGVDIIQVKVEQNPDIASQRGVLSAPTLQVYTYGKLAIQEGGYFSLDKIFERIDKYIKIMNK